MRTGEFDFALPPELIAQAPAPVRDQSRLLVFRRDSEQIAHRGFRDLLEYLKPGDVLVLNNSRVVPARLRGANSKTGGQFEVLLVQENTINDWWAMLRPGKRARVGTQIIFQDFHRRRSAVHAIVVGINEEGHRRLQFGGTPDIADSLDHLGEVPLPPYINRPNNRPLEQDRERYQTVFAQTTGSVAAPTAGLHFTESLMEEFCRKGAEICFLTLHVGLGTFAPVKTETIAAHQMHEERYELSEETVHAINRAKRDSRRVLAVGTTTVRVLESVATLNEGRLVAGRGSTRIFIFPPYDFKIADALLTNFHLPCSTLLMLVSAFAAPKDTRGCELMLSAYAEAIRERYRFFSYGDAMLIL